jgi:hypothetical protein
MENTISNLSQKEFEALMEHAHQHALQQEYDLLREIVRDYCGDNILKLSKEALGEMVG